MAKLITEEQIKAVEDVFYKMNAPVQTYAELQKFFKELPDADTSTDAVHQGGGIMEGGTTDK